MSNLFSLANLISLTLSTPNCDFSSIAEHATQHDIQIMEQNSIDDWDSYYNYLLNEESESANSYDTKSGNVSGSVSDAIDNLSDYLNKNYSNYDWFKDDDNSALTSDVSKAIPIEMQTTLFRTEEIEEAIIASGVEGYTAYGGCGPIAAMGILDYFARYLDYKEIISDPTNSDKRIILASTVLSHTYFSIFGETDNTLVWPWDYRKAFNKVISVRGLGNQIEAKDYWTLMGNEKKNYWNKIVASINEGIPVTLFTGSKSGDGEFSKHYTNIYGYETWTGISKNNDEKITKQFIKARLNWGRNVEYYCDSDILDCGETGIITYKMNYINSYDFHDSDFANDFVNQAGNGQYYFYNIDKPVTLANGRTIQTSRLRTSYIENEYLVMSPNREGAGNAYLDITFPHNLSRLSFDSSMWSSLEGAFHESFVIQYLKDGEWIDQLTINPSKLATLKGDPDSFVVLFPKTANRIRFYATHSNPYGDRNKGRICLDNFNVSYS